MNYLYGECQACGKTVKVEEATGLVVAHAAQPEWSTAPPEHCVGSGQRPYEHGVDVLADYRAALLQQANALALEHLNTAVTENVDLHGRSWACLRLPRSAFHPRGGVLWVLGRIMQNGKRGCPGAGWHGQAARAARLQNHARRPACNAGSAPAPA